MKWPLDFRQRIVAGYLFVYCAFIFGTYFLAKKESVFVFVSLSLLAFIGCSWLIFVLLDRIRTQGKHIVEERNEKEAILESLGEGVLAVDRDMRIRYVNYIRSEEHTSELQSQFHL